MSWPEAVVLLAMAAVGVRWSWVSLLAWLIGTGWLAAVADLEIVALWFLLYPMALAVASRRRRVGAGFDALHHQKNEPTGAISDPGHGARVSAGQRGGPGFP